MKPYKPIREGNRRGIIPPGGGAWGCDIEKEDSMEIVMRKVSELTPYEKNPRLNDKAVEACAESIKAYGFKVPIIVDRNGIIVTGHTRLKAAKALGMKEVPCIIADDLTDEQIRAFRIADNKVSDFSIWDNKLLLEELEAIADFDVELSWQNFRTWMCTPRTAAIIS